MAKKTDFTIWLEKGPKGGEARLVDTATGLDQAIRKAKNIAKSLELPVHISDKNGRNIVYRCM